ncbi:MAG: adenosylmethionine decarboxylase [Fimbriimonadaceae bacterium]
MSTVIVSLSCLALGAIAVSGQKSSLLRRLRERLSPKNIAAPPVVRNEAGWTLIQCDDVESFERWLDKDEEGLPHKPGEEPSLGSHLLVELYGCEARLLEQEVSVGAAMHMAAQESEATIVAESFHEFKPFGVSGAVIIQESHYTIHTWPEHGYAAVDLFYCGGTVKVHKAVEVLRSRFRPSRIKFLVVRRGLRGEVQR